jgi:HEAT repeat protein
MSATARLRRLACLAAASAFFCAALAEEIDEFATGAAAAAWGKWQAAMQALLDRNTAQAEQLFGELLTISPSALRVALLADRTVNRTPLAGAVLLFEQDYENQTLEENGRKVAELLETGREQLNQADDGWYFCAIGRFDVAQANFHALLESKPDPVALLEFADQAPRRREMLVRLTDHPVVGESVRRILRLLDEGEARIKADPTRIRVNIRRLGGPPRAFENAAAALKQSGEYAIPFLIQALRDPAQEQLTQPILRFLPQIDRPALNPLVYALRVPELVIRRYVVEALGQIGYAQALPYLLQLGESADLPPELRSAVQQAIAAIARHNPDVSTTISAAEAFYRLARQYYADAASLAADPRLPAANVWYWKDDLLQNVRVPTQIFNEIMCMRCCEEALRLDPGLKPAQALWIAANFRREAQLAENEVDPTRPQNWPAPLYFAQTAGPGVCLMTLSLALEDADPAVALGAIEALHNTAGPAALVAESGGRLPLAEALSFPDRMVRIRAALTLGAARPRQPFLHYQNLMPVLKEALALHAGGRVALIVDPDPESANRFASLLREQGYEVISDAELLRGLDKVRQQVSALDVIVLAADVADLPLPEALRQLRSEFRFAATPVVLVSKPGRQELVRDLVRADHRLAEVGPADTPATVSAVIQRVSKAVGLHPITPEIGAELAFEAARILHTLALTDNPLFRVADARATLIDTLSTRQPELRRTVARVLALIPDSAAQEAIARIALNSAEPQDVRIEMFDILADAAKACGNLLSPDTVARIVRLAEAEPDLRLRTAAAQAMGTLNLPTDTGSQIIRNCYGG